MNQGLAWTRLPNFQHLLSDRQKQRKHLVRFQFSNRFRERQREVSWPADSRSYRRWLPRGSDHIRDRRRSPDHRSAARAVKTNADFEVVRSCNEDFALLRLIEPNMAFSIRYAVRIIARLTSRRSTCRMCCRVSTLFVESLFISRVSSIEG